MINKVILTGRITHDIEIRQTPSGASVTQFNIAVERSFAKQGEERQTDFITVVAWNKTAEFIGRYFAKGRSIAVIGQLRSRTYDDKNGTKHYVTEVFADEVQFTFEPKTSQNAQNGGYTAQNGTGYSNYAPNSNAAQNAAQSVTGLGGDFDLFNDDGCPF
jgi:single-strand DNA-binding protein